MKKIAVALYLLLILFTPFQAQAQEILQSGPMVGYSAMREAGLWVQTSKPAKVKIAFWNIKEPKTVVYTNEVNTKKEEGYTAKLTAENLEPGQVYNYSLLINGKKVAHPYDLKFQTQKLWQFRTDPPKFTFAAGSCFYVNEPEYDRAGKGYGSDYEIVKSIYEKHPDFMVWLGDNWYYREADWDSWSGMLSRITHTRSLPELQPLLASVHHYSIWDDHDFGPNDSDRGFWNKFKTLEAFKLFIPNPSFGINGKPGITSFFQWGDTDFFLLDNRFYRTPNTRKTDDGRTVLGDEQIQWLIDNLAVSKAPFKIVAMGGQFLNPVQKSYLETYSIFPEEKEKILSLIKKEKIEGVIFLTGDRHHSELTKLDRNEDYPLYEFTISSLTAGVSAGKDEENVLRVAGTVTDEHNFALFTVEGARRNRTLICTVFNVKGEKLWEYKINESELKYKK